MNGAEVLPLRVAVTLRPGAVSGRSASAFLIAGEDPAAWVRALLGCGVPLASIRLLVLPRRGLSMPAGALAIVPSGLRVALDPIHAPYALLAGRVFVPLDAGIHPPVSDAELGRLSPWDVSVLHPSLGLIGCDDEELVVATSLLSFSLPGGTDWSHAMEGVRSEPRVRVVLPIPQQVSADALAEQWRDDIGKEGAPEQLPTMPEEGPIGRAAAHTTGAFWSMVEKLTRGLGKSKATAAGEASGAKGWIGRLYARAKAKAEESRAAIEAARAKELGRLERLLRDDPDQGLRYALPLSGPDASRGRARPGGRLTSRSTDFSLRSLFGSGPADHWEIEARARQRLVSQYRELANREMRLGRHRRAAYVFAQLLGDFYAAANALREGRHFRDAAALFRDKLGQPRMAAECLEGGGLLAEAITIYESLDAHEHVGDLYRRLDREEDAVAAYRRAIDQAIRSGNRISAAGLAERKLNDPDEALRLLDEGWPVSPQATACVDALFALLGKLGRHAEASRRVEQLRTSRDISDLLTATAIEALARLSTAYPDLATQARAADATRVLAGERLHRDPTRTDAGRLLAAIARTAPADRLLARDVARYTDQTRGVGSAKASSVRPMSREQAVSVQRVIRLDVTARWLGMIALGEGFVAVGVTDSAVLIARGRWSGRVKTDVLDCGATDAIDDCDLGGTLTSGGGVGVVLVRPCADHHVPLRPVLLPSVDGMPMLKLWDRLPHDAIAATFGTKNDCYTVRLDLAGPTPQALVEWVLVLRETNIERHRELMQVQLLPQRPTRIVGHQGRALVAIGSKVVFASDTPSPPFHLAGEVLRMTNASHINTLAAIVSFDRGAQYVWRQDGELHAVKLATDLVRPTGCRLADGRVVLVAEGQGRIYRVSTDGRASMIGSFNAPIATAQALAPTGVGDLLASLGADGEIKLWRCPDR
jgi:tetratricopeptide (TPR) repeat protein